MQNFDFKSLNFPIKKFKKGNIIKNEGDLCDAVYFILNGSITISNITVSNSEFVINSLSAYDCFGENLIFSDHNYYPGNITASTNVELMVITKNNFISLLSNNSSFLTSYLSYISSKYMRLQTRLKILSQPSIKEKFVFYLQTENKLTNKNFTYIKSITELANYLNVPRPSLSRTISLLIKDKVIKKEGNLYYILNNK